MKTPVMVDLTIRQAVHVWSELQDAYRGINGYGGHTAEIYAYRLQQRDPTAEATSTSFTETQMHKQAVHEQAVHAGLNLIGLIEIFMDTYDCVVTVDDHGAWKGALLTGLYHRCHVKIVPK